MTLIKSIVSKYEKIHTNRVSIVTPTIFIQRETEEEDGCDKFFYVQRGRLNMKRYIIEFLFYFLCTWK